MPVFSSVSDKVAFHQGQVPIVWDIQELPRACGGEDLSQVHRLHQGQELEEDWVWPGRGVAGEWLGAGVAVGQFEEDVLAPHLHPCQTLALGPGTKVDFSPGLLQYAS